MEWTKEQSEYWCNLPPGSLVKLAGETFIKTHFFADHWEHLYVNIETGEVKTHFSRMASEGAIVVREGGPE